MKRRPYSDSVVRCGRSPRRDALRAFWGLLWQFVALLLLAAAVAGVLRALEMVWEWYTMAAPAGPLASAASSPWPLPLAVVEVPWRGMILPVWLLIAAGVIAWAMRKTRANEHSRRRELRRWVEDMRGVARENRLEARNTPENTPENKRDACATPPEDPLSPELRCFITRTDATAILASCKAVLCEAEEKLTRPTTREGLGVENYDEALHLATQDVRTVRACLSALLEKMVVEKLTVAARALHEQRASEGRLQS